MEQIETLLGMLNLMVCPAFCVKDGTVICVNQAAKTLLLSPQTPISQLLETGTVEYPAFQDGYLYLTLSIGGNIWGASVTRMDGYDVFILEDDQRTEIQAMALAAQQLRQPLSTIMTVADQLFPLTGTDDPAAQDQVARINKGLFQMLRIVTNMSDAYLYSKDSTGHQEIVNICAYLEETFRTAGETVSHAGIDLHFQNLHEPVFSLADSEKLERAVNNILSNALKYTPKGGTIDAKLTRRNNMLYLTVQDNGDGIPPELRGSLFSRYQRQPGIESSQQGLGLGMVIIREAASIHGGTVLLEFPKDCGTRITMTIAIRKKTDTGVSSPVFRIDYAGGRDHRLLELSDSLPYSLYKAEDIN